MRGLFAIILGVALSFGCSRREQPGVVRIGYFPNLTHAPAVAAFERGTFARHLEGREVRPITFWSGPELIEAFFAGAVDVAYVGPGPALQALARSHGKAIRIVAGAASGGAVFVLREGLTTDPASLAGKRIATPALGNTQDVALRTWLREHQLADRVDVTPVKPPDMLALFQRGSLDGAWVAEPWGAILVEKTKARVAIDERSLWPGRRFATTLVIASMPFVEKRSDDLRAFLAAHVETVRWIQAEPDAARRAVGDGITQVVGQPLPPGVLADAWSRLEFTLDPLPKTLEKMANDARALGFLEGKIDLEKAYDLDALRAIGGGSVARRR